jgi:hypothetical protein
MHKMMLIISSRVHSLKLGANVGQVIRFAPKSERERDRLIPRICASKPWNGAGRQRSLPPLSIESVECVEAM